MHVGLFMMAVCLAQGSAAEFRASAVKVDITPETTQWLIGYEPRQSTGIHDRIYHRIAVLDDGRTQFYLVASDLGAVSPAFYDEVCRAAGLEQRQMWWTVTHTHSAPEVGPRGLPRLFLPNRFDHQPDREYTARVKAGLLDGIKQARAALAPARLGVGTGFSNANINRRARTVNGRVIGGLNPDGPVDRQIGLVRLERPDGTPVALIVNYAMHGTVLGGENRLISGDGPGIVAAYVEEKLHAPVLYVNGAAGDIAPIYTVAPAFRGSHIEELNVLLGNRILAANRALQAAGGVTLRTGETIVETPRKPGFGWPAELAEYSGGPVVRLPVRFLRIGAHTVLWAAPLELFCEIAMRVRENSPFPHTFYFGYANGWLGYLPTAAGFAEGGYETAVSPFTARAEADLTDSVLAFLNHMRTVP